MTYALSFDYDSHLPPLRRIMQTSQKTQWTVEEMAWDRDSRPGDYGRILEWQGALRSAYVRALPVSKQDELARQFVAFDFSQILHGEQCAMMLASQLVNCVEDLDAKIYATIQARDEARHVEAVRKLLERIGPIYPIGPALRDNFHQLINCQLWTKQVLGLQLFLEGRALLSFREHLIFVDDVVFRDVVRNIELDESQHVAFGIQYIARGIEDMSAEEREQLIQYGVWLDNNMWKMTKAGEYRAVFEECDLDFDEFQASYLMPSFLRPSLGGRAETAKSVDRMHDQFHRWFYGALHRVGLTEVIERRLGRPVTPADLGTAAPDGLPWVAREVQGRAAAPAPEAPAIAPVAAVPAPEPASPPVKTRAKRRGAASRRPR